MKRGRLLALLLAIGFSGDSSMSQTNKSEATRWLEKAPVAPDFSVPATRKAWEKKRWQVRKQLWHLLGKLPPRPKAPCVKTLSREDRGAYAVEKFQFDNEAGATVPGYLLLPKKVGPNGKCPAILYCHCHGGQYDVGKEELFRTNAVTEPPGPALVKRGYAVLAIDACCFGERSGKGPGGPNEMESAEEMSSSKFNLWFGRTLWGMMLRDDLMALDYLLSRPEVNKERVGVTGMSMGATRTWWLMALEERIKTGVAVACLTRYEELLANEGLKYHGIYYFVPGMLNYFDTEAVVSLVAPRPILFQTGDRDFGSPVDGIHRIESTVRGAYKLYGKENEFESILYPNVGHEYTRDMWERMLAWMGKYLMQQDK
jgi:dienelactone hydrolase